MKMSIFAFTLAVALAAGSAYSEMIAMSDSPGSVSGTSDVSAGQGNKAAAGTRKEADGIASERSDQGY